MALDLCNTLHGLKPVMVMVLCQIIYAGLNVFYKLATKDGMDLRILVAYRYIMATVFLVPIAFFVERNRRPKLTWTVTLQAFLCGLFGGTMSQNLYLSSLTVTSVTFTAAMSNLIPAITYIMAVILGLEKLGIRTLAGRAKMVGTAICIGGAMVLSFYKGAEINIWSTNIDLTRGLGNRDASHQESSNLVLGLLLALGCCICYAVWLNIQAKMNERYPCYFSSTALICIMGSIQSVAYALCMERRWEEWKLGWNIRLWTVTYAGIFATGVMFTVIAWTVRARGPLFVAVFNPLLLVLVAILGSLLLNEKLHVGSVVGGTVIVMGLYVVLWGKGKEMKKMMSQLMPSKSDRVEEHVEVVIFTSTSPSSSPITNNDMNSNDKTKIHQLNDASHNLTIHSQIMSTSTKEKDDEEDVVVNEHP